MFSKWKSHRRQKQLAEQQQKQQQQQQPSSAAHDSSPAQGKDDSLPVLDDSSSLPIDASVTDAQQPDGNDHDEAAHLDDIDHLRSLNRFLSSRVPAQCAGCSGLIDLSANNVTRSIQRWWKDRAHRPGAWRVEMACGLYCGKPSCNVVTCPCGSKVGTGLLNRHEVLKTQVSGNKLVINHCCSEGRLLVLWALALAISQIRPSSTPSGSSAPRDMGNGTNAAGVGYASSEPFLMKLIHRSPAPNPARPQEDAEAMMMLELRLRVLACLLPNCSHDDMGLVAFMLARSDLLSWAADLLVNDFAEETQKQYQLYGGLLDFIEALAHHSATTQLVTQPRSIYGDGGRLNRISFLKMKNISSQANAVDTAGKSLESMLEATQAKKEKMIQYTNRNRLNREDATGDAIATRISQIVQTYRAKAVVESIAELQITPVQTKTFADYHQENALAEVSDDEILRSHVYSLVAEKTGTAPPPRNRMKRVIREISVLQSSLPEGVFVRFGSSRPDVLKFLIIGPKDTPYADGFFLFDMFLPLNFPQVPPAVHLSTTPCGKDGLNPNLYHNGYVCLSLLGTWSGEPWRPEQSTLLQVLVSIQSMIFCAEPYYNEPFRCKSDVESKRYTQKVRQMTYDCAIAPWIRATAAAYGGVVTTGPGQANVNELWKDVAVQYFGKDSSYRAKGAPVAV
ncbi:hypothetical protein PG993_010842 [Apiospora rasikravindrae]|uniref:UBC core domain-containing protein n=1 Tax=Apiospora rasikravindrae TaxID=990691 RepID=A0ABR1SCU1_9PEZI